MRSPWISVPLQRRMEYRQNLGTTELCGLSATGFSKQMPVVWLVSKTRKLVTAGFWFQNSSAVVQLFFTLNKLLTSALKENPSHVESVVVGDVWFGGAHVLPLQTFSKPLRYVRLF